ncbi:MAG: type IX secretion system sortase PorU [Bacteroidales bacterium]|jgi:hypothetical protein|nr:type IX secretion system sortase PorU [Bacteroidales bacterium]
MKRYLFLIIGLCLCFETYCQSITYSDTSVLASGSWYAITIPQSGIYRLTREDFKKLGVPEDSINFDNLSIWGQGGQAISKRTADYVVSDLLENAIYVNNQGNPYALFYGEGNIRWIYNNGTNNYSFEIHPYSDVATYFVCFDPLKGEKKRIDTADMVSGSSDYDVVSVRDVFLHNRDLVNPKGAGNSFYGETLTHLANEIKIPVNLIDFVPNSIARIRIVAGSTRAAGTNVFNFKFNNQDLGGFNILPQSDDPTFTDSQIEKPTQPLTTNLDTVTFTYTAGSTRDKANLDYILVNYDKYLRFNGSPLMFNATVGVTENKIAEYHISNVSQPVRVWNVTNPISVEQLQATQQNNEVTLKLNTQSLQKIIVFSGSNFPTPALKGKVENQNLHSTEQTDFIIITAPEFINQAERLAELHRTYDSIKVTIVLPQQIYNEFSSGTKDYLAFREFLRMMYKKYSPSGQQPKNVLLFGDGTYDSRNILKYNNNFIPTYQDADDFCSDIYVAHLSDNTTGDTGGAHNDVVLIGVGRFTVNDTNEANLIVDKCRRYLLKEDLREGGAVNDWKNYSTLTCDDDDKASDNVFVSTSEAAYDTLVSAFPVMNAYKVYSDAYKQQNSSAGSTYPDATKAINNRMNKGALTLNYVGHGSADHLSSERLITMSDITSWTNFNQPTLFITSTCEFTKFDMVDKPSGGEYAFLSRKGGAIALVSSTRRISSNESVNAAFHKNFVQKQADGKTLTLGEAFAKCQNANKSHDFVLIGDPALRLNIAIFNVHTKTINGNNVEDTMTAIKDTVRALSQMSVTGDIRDNDGNVLTDFNGKILITLFDKVKIYYGLDNEGHGSLKAFEQQKNVLYKGTANVVNGEFDHNFTIPKDISYNYGEGKLSYYAKNDSVDASGQSQWFIVGGIDNNVQIDTTYPVIKLYMNDTNFRYGGITDQNPDLYAIIEDSIAINTVGSGLGHDIMARLDNAANTFVLNDFYETDVDNPNKGYIRFPFTGLSNGEHTLTLKVWNIFNFSSEKTITFVVNNGKEPVYTNLTNYPNPFESSTTIVLEHNQPDKIKEATIYIFDMSGRVVRKIVATPYISTYTIGPLTWDGTDQGGKRLQNGVYIYKAVLDTNDGEVHSAGKKMVIFNRNK